MLPQYLLLVRTMVVVSCFLPDLVWVYSVRKLEMKGIFNAPELIFQFLKVGLSAEDRGLGARLILLVVLNACALFAAFILPRRIFPTLDSLSGDYKSYLARLPQRWVGLAILAAAAVGLVLELTLIRWQGAVYEMFAFYKNFGVLACFAGLGLGYATSKHDQIPVLLTALLVTWQILLLTITRDGPAGWNGAILSAPPVLEQLNMGLHVPSLQQFGALMLLLTVTFVLTALAFVPIGQLCGCLMERRPKLRAYSLNLTGSLVGVLLFLGLSFLRTPPAVWFVLCYLLILAFQTFDRRVFFAGMMSTGAAVIVLTWPVRFPWTQVHSPYQLLELGPDHSGGGGLSLRAAGHYYQRLLNLSSTYVKASGNEFLKRAANYYELPYKIADVAGNIAIVGAGTGNDVAAALRMGANTVDAIEIDPVILDFGKAYHPEQPYQDERVRVIVNDARTHLRGTEQRYDMIVYGLLDSHTLLSHASNVRLDSFIYTVEAFREARNRLKEGGVLIVSFSMLSPKIGRKLYLMLEEAFDGAPPISIKAGYDAAVIFLQGKGGQLRLPPGLVESLGFSNVTSTYADRALRADVSTDDWPFLYMPIRNYPVSYLGVVGLMLVLSVGLTKVLFHAKLRFSQTIFFLLGAGFMLVETKNITELGLTFGNTWHVIGIAIAGILTMAFIANVAVERFGIRNLVIPYMLLMVTLAAGLIIALNGGFPSTIVGRIGALVVLSSPLFFSGMVFSTALQYSEDISGALAANLVGAMCGGLLEYNSMYFGFASLYWAALGLYGAAFLLSFRLCPG